MENDDRSVVERTLPSFGPALADGSGHFVILLAVAVSSVEKFYVVHEAGGIPLEEHRVCVWRPCTRELEQDIALLEVSLFDPEVSAPTAGDSDPVPEVLFTSAFSASVGLPTSWPRRSSSHLRYVLSKETPTLPNVVSQTREPCPTPITRRIHQSVAPKR